MTYLIGQDIVLNATFTDADEVAIDPSALDFKVISPAGIISTYTNGSDSEVAKISTGIYEMTFSPEEVGTYHYRWAATGDVVAALDGHFEVGASPLDTITDLILEDGTGLSTATTYVSLPEANFALANYMDEEYWQEAEFSHKINALVRASKVVDQAVQWVGKKKSSAQALAFPRSPITDKNGENVEGVPEALKSAVAEYALYLVMYGENSGMSDVYSKIKIADIEVNGVAGSASGLPQNVWQKIAHLGDLKGKKNTSQTLMRG